ncbi:MAG: hypothetical protein AAB535_03505 [Patescibacteria group bacterium]
MKRLDRLKEFYRDDIGSPIDAILVIGGVILVVILLLGVPTYLETLYEEIIIPIWNLRIGDVTITVLGSALLFGVIVVGYQIQYKIEKWREKRKEQIYNKR